MAAAAVAVIACNKENVEQNNPTPATSDGVVTFTAGFDALEEPAPGTRTNLAQNEARQYTKMVWSAGDVIGVVDKNGKVQPFTTEAGGATAIFKGAAEAPESTWYAFYPYNVQAEVVSPNADPTLNISIPEVQFAKKDGVSDNVTTLVGSCSVEGNSIMFTHVCGFVQINAPEGCVSVTLELPEANENEGITGGVGTKFYKWGTYSTKIRYRSVTLVSQEGMAAGNYYIAVKPIKYTGKVRITMHHKDGSVFVKEASKLSVGAGEVLPVNITGISWSADKEINLFTGAESDKLSNLEPPFECSITKVTDEKLIAPESVRWAFDTDIKSQWAGYLGFNGSNVDLADYVKDYALEYYIKCNLAAVTNIDKNPDPANKIISAYELYTHSFNEQWDDKSWGVMSPRCTGDTYSGIGDTGWHRISIPLDKVLTTSVGTTLKRIQMKPIFSGTPSLEALKTYEGHEFYINNLRIVRITPTE